MCECRDSTMESPRNPLALLPEECWERILNKIVDPADLLNCYRTCQLWNDLLNSKKTIWLFPAIFSQLVNYINDKDILQCRSVSKSWKATIDHHLQEGQFNLSDTKQANFHLFSSIKLNFHRYENPREAVQRLELEVGGSARNPVLSRAVEVNDEPDYALDFLKKFGTHVWHLTIKTNPDQVQVVDLVPRIRDYLLCTPNLRTLDFDDRTDPTHLQVVEEGHFERFFAQNPLPPLPHLHTLIMCLTERVTEESTSFEQEIVAQYVPNLRRLHLWQEEHTLLPRAASNLTHLSCGLSSVAHLTGLQDLEAPLLQVLRVYLNTDVISSRDAFRAAERFGATLKYLCVDCFSEDENVVIEFPDVLHLPVLEMLKLVQVCATSDISFEFLESLSNLRWLEIQFSDNVKIQVESGEEHRVEPERVGITQYLERNGVATDCGMYLSNIWTVLPVLERVTLSALVDRDGDAHYTKIFSRDWYEYLHDKLKRMNIM